MDKIASYKIITKRRIILEYHSGDLIWTDIVDLKKKEYSDPDYNGSFDLIGDIRDCFIKFQSEKEISEFLGFVENVRTVNSKRKIAILTATPNNVVNFK